MTTTPPNGPFNVHRVAANEETTVLTPVTEGSTALDRIPVSRQRLWIAVTAVGVILLAVAIGLIVHLRNVSLKWEQQVTEVKAQNYDLGQRVASEQAQVVNLHGENDQLASQLKTVQQKVLDLGASAAQQGDNVQFYARQIDQLTTTLSTAKGVANALDRCIEGKTQLIGYLKDAASATPTYDPAQITDFEASLKIKCDNAVTSNVQLQQVLTP
ncbi:hypothetical protein [Demequina lutea]|uniref:FtsZ-binding cell division protein ZapB n=1 Tax=Demequina lutea TaxID=431489 RepID=A0A7Y9ZBV0_9MICO|nr:hypothetical protein [Demequina lutea]NYI41733.1 FtsZ-binding cell division protein ZapB [Demequina lutea]